MDEIARDKRTGKVLPHPLWKGKRSREDTLCEKDPGKNGPISPLTHPSFDYGEPAECGMKLKFPGRKRSEVAIKFSFVFVRSRNEP